MFDACDGRRIMSTSFPDDPAWYAMRTASQIADELHYTVRHVYFFLRNTGYAYKRKKRSDKTTGQTFGFTYQWPTDPAWYAARRCAEIARAMRCRENYVYKHCKRHGFTYRKRNEKSSVRDVVPHR